jgi:PAS domain S-box-containing protein
VPETLESPIPHSWTRITDKYFQIASKMHGSVYSFWFALVLVLLALMVRLAIAPFDAGLPYVTFFPAIALAALVGGFWPGMFATLIGIAFATIILTPPYYTLSISVLHTSLWPNVVFFVDGIIVSTAIEIMHRYRQKFTRGLNSAILASATLAKTESKYQSLMKTSIDGIHIMDIDGNLLEANDAFCSMLGYSQEEISHLNVTDWVGNITKDEMRSAFKSNLGKNRVIEVTHCRKNGTLLDVEVSISYVTIGDHNYVVASSRDITERKKLNSELLQTTKHLRELVANYESAQEAERKSIAREVHDELGQILSTLRLNISMIRTRFGKHHTELLTLTQNVVELVDRAIHGVRNVSENLRPAVLGIGIFVSIKWLCDNFTDHSGISCILDSPDPCVELDEARAVVIFRIVQESLTNVMRHAHANSVKISISTSNDNLCVEVKDDGKGFDMSTSKPQTTYGLFGMRERALACGGNLDISSTPGKGTIISVRIPISSGIAKQ